MSFTIATNNVPHYAPEAKVARHIKGPFQRSPKKGVPPPSLINLQEFMKYLPLFLHLMPKSWRAISIFGPEPLAYDTKVWTLKDTIHTLVYHDTKVGKKGAGPATLAERFVEGLVLVHKETGFHLHDFNLHAAPSIYLPKQPGAEASRDELHQLLMDATARAVVETKVPCLVTGDFNAEWHHSNLDVLRSAGLERANRPNQPTHGKAQIDLILYRGGKGKGAQLDRKDSGLLPKVLKDDHSGVWAKFDFVMA